MGGAIFFKACGAGKGQGEKKVLSKNTRSSCGALLLIRAFLERAGERPTCSKLARRKRLAEIGTKRENRSRARGRSTASSRARRHLGRRQPEMTAARAYVLSSCRSYLPLEIPKFSACGAGLAPQAPISLPQEGHKAHRRNGRIDGLYKLYAVHCCWSGARCWCGCKMRKYW